MPKWTFCRNDGGASLLYKGYEVAHIPEILYSTSAEEKGIPMKGIDRAKWLCEIMERKDAVPESQTP